MIGERLRQLRLQSNLTQDELGKSLNLSTSTISMYENNSREPDINTLIKLSRFFGVTTDYILGISEHKFFEMTSLVNADNVSEYIIELKQCLERVIELLNK